MEKRCFGMCFCEDVAKKTRDLIWHISPSDWLHSDKIEETENLIYIFKQQVRRVLNR